MTKPSSSKTPIIDTSPLIFLTKIERLDLLQGFYSKVFIPNVVVMEIQQYGSADITLQSLQQNAWLVPVESDTIPASIQAFGLDAGESAVLARAFHRPGTEAILDDLAGRRCANQLDIPVRGTLGLVLAAKNRKEIAAARPIIQELKQAGMYLSDRVID